MPKISLHPWQALVMAIVLLPATTWASSMETLLMPGDLISGHAEYEKDCDNCHVPFSKTGQDRLCLDCHKKVAADLREESGFHTRAVNGGDVKCRQCHTEHQGRTADIVRLDEETFDHGQTDFALKGAHRTARCGSCHKPEKKRREAKKECAACHKDDSPHRDDMGETCAECHNEHSWITTDFDHDSTDFPLKGRHRKTTCNSCHPNERYKDIATQCYACHRLNDVHKTRYGTKCSDCHGETKWKEIDFDHDRDTKYRLEGKHREAACDSCHKGDLYKDKTDSACIGCHRNDDDHKGRFGEKCGDCHTTKTWSRPVFDHDRDTEYRLEGRHRELKCNHCHGGNVYTEDLPGACFGCHKKDDIHNNQQGKRCERCHNERDWSQEIVFDHDVTHFPLIGAHAVTPCEECHLNARFRDTPADCHRCHGKNDEHRGRLGRGCGMCHNPNGWRYWIFDHNTQTDFRIDGAHEKLNCHACHVSRTRKIDLPGDCGSCHQRDDEHAGGFGPRCERCHDTEAFSHISIDG